MKNVKFLFFVFAFLSTTAVMSQDQMVISGKIIDQSTQQPLEYASVIFQSKTNINYITGEITDENGDFSFEVNPDVYEVKVEYMGFEAMFIPERTIDSNWDMGTMQVSSGQEALDDLVIEVERAPVEIRLDKRIYNVGDDDVVRGGTASDVLDNVPSVSVDADGTVSLRGNESVRVLIDGKPSGMASNIGEALKMLSAESIDQVEVITNPSARYEAEGGAGIINIRLKKGDNQGLNGSVSANYGDPTSYGATASINYKGDGFNLYTNLGYDKRKTFGNSFNETEYFDEFGNTTRYVNEYSRNTRERQGFNGNFGFEWNLTDKLTWNNNVTLRNSTGEIPKILNYDSYDAFQNLDYSNTRQTEEADEKNTVEYSTDFTYNFNDKGHHLFVSGTVSKNRDIEDSNITTFNRNNPSEIINSDITLATENELRHILRLDYVLPVGEGQFEAGYLGNFNQLNTKFNIETYNDGVYEENPLFQSNLDYEEKVHAIYTQYGNKINKWSYMVGLRWEASEIDVNQLYTQDFNNKKYNNFFPSAFLNYEFTPTESATISYSKRVRRPRGRMLNPISNYSKIGRAHV